MVNSAPAETEALVGVENLPSGYGHRAVDRSRRLLTNLVTFRMRFAAVTVGTFAKTVFVMT